MFTVFGAYNRDTSIAKRTLENNIITVDPLKKEDVYIEIIGAVNQNGDVKNNKIIIKNMLGDTVMAGITDKGDAIGNEIFIENGSFFGYTGVKKFNEYGEPEDVAGNTASLIAGYTDGFDFTPVDKDNTIIAKGQVAVAGLEGFDTLIIEVDPEINGVTNASYDDKGDMVGTPNTKTISNGGTVEAKHVITIIDDGLPKKGRAMLFAAPLGGSVTAKKASIDLSDKTIIVRQAAGAGALEFSDLDNKIAYGLIGADKINFKNTTLINTSTFINEVKILNSATANVTGTSINGALNGNFNTDIPTPELIANPDSYYNKQKVLLGIPVAPVTPPVIPPVAPVTPGTPADQNTPSSSPSVSNPNSSAANTTSNALNTNRLPDGVVVSHRSITLTPEAATLTSAMLGEASVLGYSGNFAATRNIDSAFKTALQDESLNSANLARNLNAKNAIKAKAGEQGLIWDNNTSRIVTFEAGELKHLRHSADAHTRINSWNGSAGVAHLGDVNGGDLWLKSAFVEFGGGRSRSDIGIAHGYGNHKYIGLGLATRYNWENGVFAELTARVGKSETHFEGEYSRTAQKVKYTNSRLYWGAHVGLGYAYELAPNWQLVPSTKYVFTQLKGGNVDVKFEGGGRNELEVKNINTHSLRLSVRLEHTLSENCDIYGAATYQRTWGSKASSWLHSGLGSAPLFTPSLKGNTLIGTLGGGMKIAKNTRIEAGVEGYILIPKAQV